jgi:hypothetical protein
MPVQLSPFSSEYLVVDMFFVCVAYTLLQLTVMFSELAQPVYESHLQFSGEFGDDERLHIEPMFFLRGMERPFD